MEFYYNNIQTVLTIFEIDAEFETFKVFIIDNKLKLVCIYLCILKCLIFTNNAE